jgi:1-deoxy-D-xylulose-5-phosphate reductoisomerase
MPAVLNAANEVAVAAFLEGRIKFLDIPRTVEATMAAHEPRTLKDLDQVLAVNNWAREFAAGLISGQS